MGRCNWNIVIEDIKANAGKYSRMDICEKYNMTYWACTQYFHHHENYAKLLRHVDNIKVDRKRFKEIVEQNPNKYSVDDLAEMFSVSRSAIFNLIRNDPQIAKLKGLICISYSHPKFDWETIDKRVLPIISHLRVTDVADYYNIQFATVHKHYEMLNLIDKFGTDIINPLNYL